NRDPASNSRDEMRTRSAQPENLRGIITRVRHRACSCMKPLTPETGGQRGGLSGTSCVAPVVERCNGSTMQIEPEKAMPECTTADSTHRRPEIRYQCRSLVEEPIDHPAENVDKLVRVHFHAALRRRGHLIFDAAFNPFDKPAEHVVYQRSRGRSTEIEGDYKRPLSLCRRDRGHWLKR